MDEKLNIKVAWLTPVVGVDGKLLYWEQLFKEFSKLFSEFRLFTLEFSGEWDISNIVLEKCGTYRRLYKNERHVSTGKEGYVSGISISQPYVITKLKDYSPDLIVVSEFGLFTIYAIFYAKIIKKTAVLLLVEARPQFKDDFLKNLLRVFIRKSILYFVDAVLTNGNDGLEYLMSNFNIERNKIVVKPYLISKSIRPNILLRKKKEEKVRFLYVGGLNKRKGLAYVISAFESLLPDYVDKFSFNIVGDGQERDNLELQVQRANLASHVIFHGRKSYSNLSAYYENNDVFVFPTLGDYRALVTFEALSAGLAIIGSKYDGGSLESIVEGENGHIIDPRNINELKEYFVSFIQNPNKISEYSKKSIELSGSYTYQNASLAILNSCNLALRRFSSE